MSKIIVVVLSIGMTLLAHAQNGPTQESLSTIYPTKDYADTPDIYHEEIKNRKWKIEELSDPWIPQDNDGDGRFDSALIISEKYHKVREVLDTNYDGYIDDFAYFNEDGNIVFQEIDSNHDQVIDFWIDIEDGIKINRIQRDIDYDGKLDRDYTFNRAPR